MSAPETILADALRDVPLFARLPEESESCFVHLRRGRLERFSEGEIVLSTGVAGRAIFLIDGAVAQVRSGTVRSTPGSYFGLLEILAERAVSERVQAATAVLVFALPEPAVQALLEECPRLVLSLLRDCATHLINQGAP